MLVSSTAGKIQSQPGCGGRKGEKSKRRQQNKVLRKDKALLAIPGGNAASELPPAHSSVLFREDTRLARSKCTIHDAEYRWGLIQHSPQAQTLPKAHRERCSHAEFWNNLCSAQVLSELSSVNEANPMHFP